MPLDILPRPWCNSSCFQRLHVQLRSFQVLDCRDCLARLWLLRPNWRSLNLAFQETRSAHRGTCSYCAVEGPTSHFASAPSKQKRGYSPKSKSPCTLLCSYCAVLKAPLRLSSPQRLQNKNEATQSKSPCTPTPTGPLKGNPRHEAAGPTLPVRASAGGQENGATEAGSQDLFQKGQCHRP